MPQEAICRVSGKPFVHTDRDLDFYKKIGVPVPTLCPEERRRRRFAVRNERFLFQRKSSLSGEDIIACISPKDLWLVYSKEEWWSDKWDAIAQGRDYDFNRPFWDQYLDLQKVVPTIAINGVKNENCPYANYAAACKNCHLIFGSVYCEDCLYGNPYYCTSCMDSLLVRDSQWCYECVTCEKCYECFYCQDCVGCNNLLFCYDCRGSKNCIGSVGLRNKEYMIFNKQYSKEDYEKFVKQLNLCDPKMVAHVRDQFEKLKMKHPRRFSTTVQCENVAGDYIYESKNTLNCYDVQRCEDVSYSAQVIDMKDCYDCNYTEENELCFEYICNYHNQRCFYSVWMFSCSDIWYSSYCTSSKNLFGCIGLKHKEYCILNKQYSKEEYEAMIPRIIEHMKKDGAWGEFFPVELSLFPYNETVAQEYFPMTKEAALARGYRWRDKDPKQYLPQTVIVTPEIKDVHDTIVNEMLACDHCGKNFKVVKMEVEFYRKFNLPIPKKCPDCRHKDRMSLRNPRQLWTQDCGKCGTSVESTYSPERKEMVYCENCYLASIN